MNGLCMVIVALGLIIGGNNYGRSKEKFKVNPSIEKSEKELHPMEMEIVREWEALEEAEALEDAMAGETEISNEEWDYDNDSALFESFIS